MAAHQVPPSLGFSRQEHWSGLPFPSPIHEREKWKWSRSVVSDSSRPHGPQPTRLLRPWDFPGKSTGVGCHCMWDECNCAVVWEFFGIAFLWAWNENWLFQSCGRCWVFQICWHIECSPFTASSFRIWNSSTGIPSPRLAFFIVMLSKAHLTSRSRMSGSRSVITPFWLSGSWRSLLDSSSVYSYHIFFFFFLEG